MQETKYHSSCVDHEEIRHFRDHKNDWNVESERTAKKPEASKFDSAEGMKVDDFEETYSVIRQRSDGSIYFEDNWGSCVDMTKGDVSISAKRDLKFQAGRDVLITGAREGAIRTQKDMNIVSHDGFMRIKAHEDLRLFAEKNASLDSHEGNTVVLSRKGETLIRSERKNVVIKSDLGKIQLVSVTTKPGKGGIDFRCSQDISILSDTGSVSIHGKEKVGISSGNNIVVGVGPETSSPSMESSERNAGSFTDTSNSIDNGNSVNVNPMQSYLSLDLNRASLMSEVVTKVSSKVSAQVFVEGAALNITPSNIDLTSAGGNNIIKAGGLQLNQTDDDTDEQGPDNIWTPGGGHNDPTPPTTPTSGVVSVKADVLKDEFADGRFRYAEEEKEDHKIYQYPWQNMDPEKGSEGLVSWAKIIPTGEQDVPDVGTNRPVSGDRQEGGGSSTTTSEDETERMLPYSKYNKYNYGTFSWKDGVKSGNFEETKEFLVPDPDSTATTTDSEDKGRVNLIPDSAKGESFEGSLEVLPVENPSNESLRREQT
jgi:hypothetical protein